MDKTNKSFQDCFNIESDRVLGQGSFSIVYEASCLKNETKYAVKCLEKNNMNQDEILALMDEVSILQELTPLCHPSIIPLYNFFEESSMFYLVMEAMVGGELFDRIAVKQFYSEKEARDVCKIILNSVDFLHSRKVAHRDLKPDNFLLVSTQNDALVKLGDFGFSKRCNDTANSGLGDLKTQLGTPAYIAPEILDKAPFYGSQCDMWSVGVIMYVLLGGYEPFYEAHKEEMYRKIMKGDFEFHSDCWGDVSMDAKILISSLLEVDPSKRLSARDALRSKWICTDDKLLAENDLTTTNFCKLKKYNAKRKIRAVVHSLIAVNKLNILRQSKKLAEEKS
jgi:calcium/calmodulin-dependent protein kinase I